MNIHVVSVSKETYVYMNLKETYVYMNIKVIDWIIYGS